MLFFRFKLAVEKFSYKLLFWCILSRFDPEKIHEKVMTFLGQILEWRLTRPLVKSLFTVPREILSLEKLNLEKNPERSQAPGLTFHHPVGLAAGFDKEARLGHLWSSLGFAFAEIGTITPRAQIGNPTPRLERIPSQQALLNRMGFNNHGLEALKIRLSQLNQLPKMPDFKLGINLGKNKDTPQEKSIYDYTLGLKTLEDFGDYFVINVSSPNTPGLRSLQNLSFFQELAAWIHDHQFSKPILIKLSPELEQPDFKTLLEGLRPFIDALKGPFHGFVLTNTLPTPHGGLSGAPLTLASRQRLLWCRELYGSNCFIISVGGIMTPDEACFRLQMGANAVQLYSGFIYTGPSLIMSIRAQIHGDQNQGAQTGNPS